MPTTPNSSLIKAALGANAGFSLVAGLALTVAAASAADLIGSDNTGLLRAVGVGLVAFSLLVAFAGRRARVRPVEVLLISIADFTWVLGSLSLLLLFPESFSLAGIGLFSGVAVVVAAFGVAQLIGLRRLLEEPTPNLGEYRYCLAVDVAASPEAMWRVVSNLGAIERYLPTLASSALREVPAGCVSTGGVGCVRECVSTRQQRWAEQVTRFDAAARTFEVRFLADEPRFPFPMKVMHGGWQVVALADGHSRVAVWWSLTPRVHLGGLAIVALLAASVDRDFPAVIERMAADATGQELLETPVAKLAGVYC